MSSYKYETVLIVRDTCDESFLCNTPAAVRDSIDYDNFHEFTFVGVHQVRGWADLDMCAAYKCIYGWTLYCQKGGKLDKILRPKVSTSQH